MRTKFILLLVMSMAVTGMVFQMSGFNDMVGYRGDSEEASDEFEDVGNDSAPQKTVGADARTDESGTLVGVVITGISGIANFVGLVALLPVELNSMGFPWWFAYPIGLLAQAIIGIGFIQFASNRVFR